MTFIPGFKIVCSDGRFVSMLGDLLPVPGVHDRYREAIVANVEDGSPMIFDARTKAAAALRLLPKGEDASAWSVVEIEVDG